ncbi:MAG TPA: sigma-70 family RNA polymerase sigma factor [Pirellulales bacterium]|nr:sigma-70 family RNA polymerase sigma factor [Pirellulales bacterium]
MDEAQIEQSRHEFKSLMLRVRQGDEDAAWELLDEYGPHIIKAVRRVLTDRMRSKADSSDFAQSVWASFFANRSTTERFDRPEALMAYLTQIARNKVTDEFRRQYQTQKYDVTREQSLDGSAKFAVDHLLSDDPSPSQQVFANELLAGLPADYLQVVRMRQAGESFQAIADATGLSERTARRIVRFLSVEE